jgi:hypothetical protein
LEDGTKLNVSARRKDELIRILTKG